MSRSSCRGALRGLIAVVLAISPPVLADSTSEWILLFNGHDLLGWHVAEHPDSIKVQGGEIVVFGPRAHAFYIGPTGNANFKNFHFKAQVKTTLGSNSGIYFHTRYQDEDWPNRGYEAQVNTSHGDPKKTGGLYAVQDVFQAPTKDDEWFDYEIIVKDHHIQIMINGKVTADYTEPENLNRPERHLDTGTFALQSHDPKSRVYYRNLQVKVLP